MKLEDQVTSLEISKKLKELGIRQKSVFYWTACLNYFDEKISSLSIIDHADIDPFVKAENIILYQGCSECNHTTIVTESYSAFTVAELGEMLPASIFRYPLVVRKSYHEDGVFFDAEYENCPALICRNDSLAKVMGNLLVILIFEDRLSNKWKEKWLEVKGAES